MADITQGIVQSFGNTPQAGNDLFLASQTGLTEDALGIQILNVMANDLGGASKTLYSLDDGTSTGGIRPTDLLTQDTARAEALSADHSANGAKIWITADGKVGYDASASAAFVEQLQHLAAGEYLTDSFTYAIRLGNGTLSWATATVQIAGVNDAPVITSAVVSDTIAETNATLTDSGTITFTDADHNAVDTATLTSSAVTATGVTLTTEQIAAFNGAFTIDAAGHWQFTLASPDYLAAGATVKTVFTVTVTDDHGATATQNVTVTINGTNDVPVLGGVHLGAVSEDNGAAGVAAITLMTSGVLTIADVDQGQSNFAVQAGTTGSNNYGTFTLAADGHWSYSADNTQTAIQQLGAGQSITEDNGAAGVAAITLMTSGVLTIADVDQGQSNFAVQAGTTGSNNYGTFTLAAAGHWSYSADNTQTAIQQLGAGQSITDSFTAVSSDGTASQLITVTINGTNDVPVLGGVHLGAVSEDNGAAGVAAITLMTSGVLTIADVDQGQSTFAVQAGTTGSNNYGTFTLAADGHWSYSADNTQTAIQQLGAGQSITDSFTAVSSDGTASQQITVTINGTNDVPVLGGVHLGAVSEDNGAAGVAAITLMTSGVLTIADVDQGQSTFAVQAGTTGSNNYGTFTLAADGHWSYSADNTQTAIQQLGAGQSITDSFTAVSSDGTASQQITVTINGTNDVPVLGGVHLGAVSEDNGAAGVAAITLMTSGVLTIADVDQGQSTFAVQAGTTGSNNYGTFTLAADGHWSYSADNTQTAIQQLGAGQSITDSFTAVSSDGTASQQITVTINGTNDVPVLGGVHLGAVSEDNGAAGVAAITLMTSGVLT